MDLSTFDPRTGMFRTAGTVEMMQAGNDVEDSVWDYLTYGTVSALTSAGVGLANTGIALGETLGFADSDSYIDEEAAVSNLFGQDAAGFYSRHKVGVDVAGLIVGSFVPGLAAVRALRAAQVAGRMIGPAQVTTGLRSPDIVMGSKAVQAAKEAVLKTGVSGLRNQQVRQAYMVGAQQQFMEAAAFDLAVTATMNQNAALNPEDLTYIESAKNVFTEGLPFMLGGAVLGAGLDAVRITGAINKNTIKEYERTKDYLVPNISGIRGMAPGDKLVLIAEAAEKHTALKSAIEATDTFARQQFQRGENQLKSMVLDALKEAETPDASTVRIMEDLVNTASTGNLAQVATVLSGLSKVGRVTKTDLEELLSFYSKTNTPTGVFSGTADEIAQQVATRQVEFSDMLKTLGQDQYADKLDNIASYSPFWVDMHKASGRSQGVAYPKDVMPAPSQEMLDGKLRLRPVKYGSDTYFMPDFVALNERSMEVSHKLSNAVNKQLGLREIPLPEYKTGVLLHELGHIKTNNDKTLTLIRNYMNTGMEREVLVDLVEASVSSRRNHWINSGVAADLPKKDRDLANNLVDYMLSPQYNDQTVAMPAWAKYIGTPKELLAEATNVMTNPGTREAASRKFPALAKFFNSTGNIAKSWDDSKAFYNARTKKVYSSFLPGISDVSPTAKVSVTQKGIRMDVPELGRKFQSNPNLFKTLPQDAYESKLDYLDFDAQWKMYSDLGPEHFLPAKGKEFVDITDSNLPAMERILQLATDSKFAEKSFGAGAVRYNGSVISREKLQETLLKTKQEAQLYLSSLADKSGYNEHHIAKILNIDVDRAMGQSSGDWMLYGKKDFNEPELIKMSYKTKTPADYEEATINLVGTMQRKEMTDELKQRTSAYLIGPNYRLLEKHTIDLADVGAIAPTESRATLLTALRTRLGSVREKAAYVGKVLNQEIVNKIQSVDESFVKHYDVFNKAENQGLRFELAQVDNLLRRNWYYLARGESGESYIVNKHELHSLLREQTEMGEDYAFDPAVLDNLPDFIIDALSGGAKNADPSLMAVSDEVANFYQQHKSTNSIFVDKKRKLGEALGRDPVLDENVLYPPPRDLKTSRYNAFVVPSEFTEGSDPRRYMIFAESAAEFEAKRNLIGEKYGSQYRVVTQEDVTNYKQLTKEYDKSLVFDELHFDVSVARQGRASELFPNVDLASSETLNRYRVWTIKQEESLLRSGVELRYDDVIQGLKNLDRELGAAERTALDKTWREPDTIWKDTLNVMLDQKSYGGALENLFVRVNDYIGEAGSRVLDAAFNTFRKPKGTSITQVDLDKFNSDLAAKGYNPPTLSAVEAMIASPDTSKSKTLPNLVRTLSNLTSTFMLRLDYAHSFMQLASTPILALPVIQEAKQALRGTQEGKALRDITGVVNPSNGVYEPSSAKLFAEGASAFWTPQGKEFIQQMRDRNIVTDYMVQYLNNLDFSTFNGSHKLNQVSEKIDQLAQFGSKFSGFKFAEDFTRFQVAWAVKRVGELRGMPTEELWSTISSSVDKVHGVYMGVQRPQLFQGVLGQAVGLYQTYFFNFVQNMLKFVGDGNKKQATTMAAMQTSLFGIQSWPGFGQLNQMIGETNSGNLDLYSISGADDPKSTASYFMYGLASHALAVPIDFYTRGDLALRHNTVVPTGFSEFPVVSTLAKAVGNVVNTVGLLTDDNVPISQALAHGLAHNGMNRPLQGLGNIMRNKITSNSGQIQFDNANYVDYNMSEELNWGAMFARAIGTRPLNEAIIRGNYYRDAAYQANYRKALSKLGARIQYNVESGEVTEQSYADFAKDYEAIGGDVQNFNAYWSRQLRSVSRPVMTEFQKELMREGELSRSRARIEHTQAATTPWASDDFMVQ